MLKRGRRGIWTSQTNSKAIDAMKWLGGGFIYVFFWPYFGKWSNLTSIFFRLVGSTTNYRWFLRWGVVNDQTGKTSHIIKGTGCKRSFQFQVSILFARWWFQRFFLSSPLVGEMIQFDQHIFQMGWFNHQPVWSVICQYSFCWCLPFQGASEVDLLRLA